MFFYVSLSPWNYSCCGSPIRFLSINKTPAYQTWLCWYPIPRKALVRPIRDPAAFLAFVRRKCFISRQLVAVADSGTLNERWCHMQFRKLRKKFCFGNHLTIAPKFSCQYFCSRSPGFTGFSWMRAGDSIIKILRYGFTKLLSHHLPLDLSLEPLLAPGQFWLYALRPSW